MDCIFCKIIKGDIPSAKLYEDERVKAFLDISPANKGHTLIVPKKHSTNILEDDLEDLNACMKAVQIVAKAAIKGVNAGGFNLIVNTNKTAGQVIPHTHFHIIPRFENDGLKHWPPGNYEEGEMQVIQQRIIENIK